MSQRRAVTRALQAWKAEGKPCVLATVVSSSDSAPRGVGAQLAVTEGDLWVGGLTGGCAEGAVLEQARRLISEERESGSPSSAAVLIELQKDTLGNVGPVCGATLQVLIEQVTGELLAVLGTVLDEVHEGRAVDVVRTFDQEPMLAVRKQYAGSRAPANPPAPGEVSWSVADGVATFAQAIEPAPRLIIGGAGDAAIELVRMAQQVGWRTALVDPRATWVEQTLRAVEPDVVVRSWPEEALSELGLDARTACVAAAHDEKLDLPFLTTALKSDAFYVASIGSRVVQHERRAQLESLVGPDLAARHTGPAGLNLGGSDASEIALSILAEAVARWNGRSGGPLEASGGAIRAR